MRNLTIKRTKSFVGCLAKMKVYIEDAASSEIIINNVPCRKIGELKNGENKAFQIGAESVRIFVIADKVSKGFCNEFYVIPEGEDDVLLAGACKFNPASGNAFQFDNNDNEAVLKNRKHNTHIGIIILIIACIVGFCVGYLVGLL